MFCVSTDSNSLLGSLSVLLFTDVYHLFGDEMTCLLCSCVLLLKLHYTDMMRVPAVHL